MQKVDIVCSAKDDDGKEGVYQEKRVPVSMV